MKLSRRQLLHRLTASSVIAFTPSIVWAKIRGKLSIPPLIEVGRGRPVRLDFRPSQTQFDAGKLVDVWGVNGRYLAPTVRVKSGDAVRLTYINSLPQPLSITIQGLFAPTEMVGSIHRQLAPNSSWSPILTVNQPACSGWYHADTMLNSAFQTYRGLAGFWLIEDGESRKAKLPNKYGIDDIPLILQDQLMNTSGMQVLDKQGIQFFGKRLFVNGQESPYFDVPRGWVRLRLLNASLSRHYELRLDNGKPLFVIATGVGFFAEPLEMESISLAPSERVELLVDVNSMEIVRLISGQKRGFFYTIEQLFTDDNELVDNTIIELRPQGLASAFENKAVLPPFQLDEFKLTINKERTFSIRPLDFLINQQRFDPKRLDFTAKKDTVERWYLTSDEPVGFTLQGAKFIIETKNKQKLPYKQLAWRDTVWLEKNQQVTLLVRFEHQASASEPFTFGVSDLMLRDRGCMGQFSVS
ncbi:cell division protein FtsQ [Vespertiliibacter pulmonis]|uniref:Cell division protein SufI n=1 Tax=Vespertiliibacter pulmonis TaxID=1443036 RepID=A0A3N4WE28_9PAST|nr:multicopper oxidase domain-containing protein [Vespertiliibacter pulmonis]QLB20853.1 cell division protein FtsQ [Vespertiliibacter pulmonis]RPE83504.1 cell division protein SufI [Vespertiliibacter pulmonis]